MGFLSEKMPNNVFLYYKNKVGRQYSEKNDESIKILLYVSSTLKYSCVNIMSGRAPPRWPADGDGRASALSRHRRQMNARGKRYMEERVAEGSRKVVVIWPGVGVERLARLPPPPPPPADYPHTLA
jgi:hypothetical protein